ncbi:MAG: pyruvate:ferredoxin (flavodoxin) oxidoreductase [Bacteroidales bacterium]|jgi:pyruvate-ferredoxin/flavodoxin oxidoreductase|nr:pyruvate:ferredoxin (flavodoxin) oxidoreductase [Bacteroidales bacterium]
MAKEGKYVTCDGNYAAAHVAYLFSEVAAIYPITPSSTMAEYVDEWAARGKKNLFNETVKVVEMQSEAGAAGAVHGSLQSGALTSTFTASQGLLLMIPNMYKISGELLPGVFHVSARSLAAQALSIFGDHSDVMSTRQTGFAMLATGSVQEVMDLAAVAHLTAIQSRVPFLHFFDGFRTSHEIQKVEDINSAALGALIDRKALQAFRERALNPEHPVTRGTAQNPDIYFQSREAANKFYLDLPDQVEAYMQEINKITGREYHPFTYYGDPFAENIIIAIGSITDTIKETIDYLTANGEKVGLISVHLYRPFSVKYLGKVIPSSVKRICVLDRTKEPGANGDPLYLDVVEAFAACKDIPVAKKPIIVGGRYGLSSKDTTPAHILAVYKNLAASEPKHGFTIGIVDDVTFLSLPALPEVNITPKGTFQAKFFGIGGDGTVGANKNSIKIIGDSTDKYCQAYFAYDSKKTGGITISHLRFGDSPIRSPYLVNTPDFVACHVFPYLRQYDVLKGLRKGGTFLLNSKWDAAGTAERLPNKIKKYLADNDISLYIIDAITIAEEVGLGSQRTNTILQSTFFKISGVIPYETAVNAMKAANLKSYGKKGEEIVNMNNAAVDRGGEVTKVPVDPAWSKLDPEADVAPIDQTRPEFVRKVVDPINAQQGDDLPVSTFVGCEDGTFPQGTAAYEKRGIAVNVPEWISANCIQCNQCSYICPHAAIRPFLITAQEKAGLPSDTATISAIPQKTFEGLEFRQQVSPLDCTGCGNCVDVCPGNRGNKALKMESLESQMPQQKVWDYAVANITYKDTIAPKDQNVKNSQFSQPLFEFSGACAGCGETPYVKLISQLFGDRMMIANATGCSSIYSGSAPATPYCKNAEGKGPSWGNSLFEDNAEYGLGMATGVEKMRERIARLMDEAIAAGKCSDELKAAFEAWKVADTAADSKKATDTLIPLAEKCDCTYCREILELRQYLIKKSIWIMGGDGWAYDIGYGGLDHVLASGENVNVLVLDTEVYSNTGGQASKSTPVGAVAKFAASGKRVRKKDLGMMAMSYGYVYVAQVAMGANQMQYLKALKEAEAYDGPSLIIAYSPCIAHGLRAGMGKTQAQQKLAVECGYWHTYRFNPALEAAGQNPFQLDSKEPDWTKFQDFILSEVRYSSLKKQFPAEATELFQAAEANAKWRYNGYKKLAGTN